MDAKKILRDYAVSCDAATIRLMRLSLIGMALLSIFLIWKFPNALPGALIVYVAFIIILVVVKIAVDGQIKEYYFSKYDSGYKTHIFLNRNGWIKESDKAFRISHWEIIRALADHFGKKAKAFLKR